MLRTLHGYLLRELLKTFAMTATALTALLVMGGGVANLFRTPGLGATEMGKLFAYFTPVALTMILPVAALFSTTISYGRAAADNEITAAKAAGINVHRLLLSAALLGVFVTGFTYYAWNYLIPILSGNVEELTRKDLPKIITSQFEHNKALAFGKYRLYADDFAPIDPAKLPPELATENKHYMALLGVSFIEMEDDQIARYGTADRTYVIFDQNPKMASPTVEVRLTGVRAVDRSRPVTQAVDMQSQIIGPIEVPQLLRHKMKFQNLPTLKGYLGKAEDIPEVSDLLFRYKRSMMEQYLYEDVIEGVESGGYVLRGPDATYRIQAARSRKAPATNQPELAEVTVEEKLASGESRLLTSELANVDLKNSADRENPNVVFELQGSVKIKQIPGSPDDRIVVLEKQSLLPMPFLVQPSLKARLDEFKPLKVLNTTDAVGPTTPKLEDARTALIKRKDRFVSEVQGEIHFRASYAASSVAVILLGAMLGIMLRGGQVLTAFGISCLPTAFVVVASIVGRNLADQPDKTLLSIAIMWGATGLMYLATVVLGMRVLQR